MRIFKNINRKKKVRHSWVKSGSGIQRCAICGIQDEVSGGTERP